MSSNRRGWQFYLILVMVLTIIILSIGNYQRWWDLHFLVGPLYFHHWLSSIGAGFIAVFAPIYSIIKRRYPNSYKTLFQIHVFGNLIAFLFISMHFTQHIARSVLPGTGLALYIIVAAMVATGLLQRFKLANNLLKSWRFIHVSLSLSFYIVIIIHILRNLRFS